MPEDWGPRDKRQGRTNITCSVQDEHMLPFLSEQEQHIYFWPVLYWNIGTCGQVNLVQLMEHSLRRYKHEASRARRMTWDPSSAYCTILRALSKRQAGQ